MWRRSRKGTVDGERKLFTGGPADFAGDIRALAEVGVDYFDFRVVWADAAGDAGQYAAVQGRGDREGTRIAGAGRS